MIRENKRTVPTASSVSIGDLFYPIHEDRGCLLMVIGMDRRSFDMCDSIDGILFKMFNFRNKEFIWIWGHHIKSIHE